MDIQILSERKNPHLSRVEIHFLVKHPGGPTPKRDVIRGAIADMLGVKKEFVVLDRLRTNFGSESAKGYAKIYSDMKVCLRVEREPVLIKNKLKEKTKKEEKPAESKPEPKKEEKPKEKK